VLEFELHAASAKTSAATETSVERRTIDLYMPNRAEFELQTVFDHGERLAGELGQRDGVAFDAARDRLDLDEPRPVVLRVALRAEDDLDRGRGFATWGFFTAPRLDPQLHETSS
jgi:hypothetical protein